MKCIYILFYCRFHYEVYLYIILLQVPLWNVYIYYFISGSTMKCIYILFYLRFHYEMYIYIILLQVPLWNVYIYYFIAGSTMKCIYILFCCRFHYEMYIYIILLQVPLWNVYIYYFVAGSTMLHVPGMELRNRRCFWNTTVYYRDYVAMATKSDHRVKSNRIRITRIYHSNTLRWREGRRNEELRSAWQISTIDIAAIRRGQDHL